MTIKKKNRRKRKKHIAAGYQVSRSVWKEIKLATLTYWEYIRGSFKYRHTGPAITVFGSARFGEGHPYCHLARVMGRTLAEAGFTTFTGGGPGIMRAAHQGANEAGGYCVGASIIVPYEEELNQHMHLAHFFRYFFIRKVMLTKYSCGFVIFPGGLGTMDELFEVATLMQTRKLHTIPLILMGTDYWLPLFEFIKNTMLANGTINEADLDLFTLTDSPEIAMEVIAKHAETNPC
ncbi:MAG: TIGR00730 family Rossman fold protein [Coxiellaceae bacterium]|nr:TIGR00730 family Rossman fold protein [Coxiellaceae bacterium]